MNFIEKNDLNIKINKNFTSNMKLEPKIYVNNSLSEVLFNEYLNNQETSAFNQLAHIATLPGVKAVYGLPDIHSGYGFPIGSVSGFDVNDGIIAPGGIGYDINCGVRSLATNMELKDIENNKEETANLLFDMIPSGMVRKSGMEAYVDKFKLADINEMLDSGLEYLVKSKMIDESELEFVENNGKMKGNSRLVCQKAKARGLNQIASLGSGNHYLEIQCVEKIYDKEKAALMGINKTDQLIITIHTGSRGLGYNVCEDFLNKIEGPESTLKYLPINSDLGMKYYSAMGSAANYGFCNRALISKITKDAFSNIFKNFEAHLIYDVCHNIGKREYHFVDNEYIELMVHRKGASRAFGPFCHGVPDKYQLIGQPVLAGGSMGTSSYILVGTEGAMKNSLGSSCHGAGRLVGRKLSHETFTVEDVLKDLKNKGIELKCGSTKGIVEEAPGAYKNVEIVAEYCEEVGISNRVCKVKPVIVIKG